MSFVNLIFWGDISRIPTADLSITITIRKGLNADSWCNPTFVNQTGVLTAITLPS